MANGFFLGGMAEGAMGAQKQALAERTQSDDTAIRSRGLDLQGRQLGLQERQFERTLSQDVITRADAQIADTLAIVGETIKQATAVGRPPEQIMQTVTPLVQSAQSLAARVGRDPNAIAARVQAQISNPGLVETAGATGRAAGTQRIEEARTTAAVTGEGLQINPFKTEEERVKAENSLRDDYVKASKDFVTVRDFFDRMKSATPNGAGDIALVFSFMKMLDPTSTVREGEYATASNAGGVPSAIHGMYNRLISGGVLGETARTQIKGEGAKMWATALNRHSSQVTQYRDIARRQGLRPANVIIDLTAGSEGPTSGTTATGINWNLR